MASPQPPRLPTTLPTSPMPSPPPHQTATGPATSEAPGSTSKARGKRNLRARIIQAPLWQWNVELWICFLIFVIPFVALGTLLPYHAKPLPQWPLRITINALISVYPTVLKAAITAVLSSGLAQLQWALFTSPRPLHDAVRYDEATRGPWGALQILWFHRLRQPLAALGALLVVLTVAFDPFVQQLLRTVSCSIRSDQEQEHAALPRTNLFGDFVTNNSLRASYSSGEVDMRLATQDGLISSGTTQVAQCPTGNCTFPTPFTTLGICHECLDNSDQVTVEDSCVAKFPLWRTSWDHHCPENTSLVINSTWHVETRDESFTMRTTFPWPVDKKYNQTNVSSSSSFPPMELFAWSCGADGAHIHCFFLVGETLYSQSRIDPFTGQEIQECQHPNNWQCQGHGAARCTLRLCVREYSATVEAGLVRETLLSRSPVTLPPRHFHISDNDLKDIPALLDSRCYNSTVGGHLEERGYRFDPQVRWQVFNVTKDNQTATPIYPLLLEEGCLFSIPNREDLLLGIDGILQNIVGTLWTHTQTNGLLLPFFQNAKATQHMLHIHNYGNVDFERIDSIMAKFSESITRLVRTHGNPKYSKPAAGFVWRDTICVRVDWRWSVYPVALAIGTLAFFALVLGLQEPATPVWKSSPLAWILRRAEAAGPGWIHGGYVRLGAAAQERRSREGFARDGNLAADGPHAVLSAGETAQAREEEEILEEAARSRGEGRGDRKGWVAAKKAAVSGCRGDAQGD